MVDKYRAYPKPDLTRVKISRDIGKPTRLSESCCSHALIMGKKSKNTRYHQEKQLALANRRLTETQAEGRSMARSCPACVYDKKEKCTCGNKR